MSQKAGLKLRRSIQTGWLTLTIWRLNGFLNRQIIAWEQVYIFWPWTQLIYLTSATNTFSSSYTFLSATSPLENLMVWSYDFLKVFTVSTPVVQPTSHHLPPNLKTTRTWKRGLVILKAGDEEIISSQQNSSRKNDLGKLLRKHRRGSPRLHGQ